MSPYSTSGADYQPVCTVAARRALSDIAISMGEEGAFDTSYFVNRRQHETTQVLLIVLTLYVSTAFGCTPASHLFLQLT